MLNVGTAVISIMTKLIILIITFVISMLGVVVLWLRYEKDKTEDKNAQKKLKTKIFIL